MMRSFCLFIISYGIFYNVVAQEMSYDSIYEELVKKRHILDSLNLLIFNILLVLTVLTVWLFKHRRIPYLHETGLALIYGLIAGAIIKYGPSHYGSNTTQSLAAQVQLKKGYRNYSADFVPANLLLSLHGTSVKYSTLVYKLQNRLASAPKINGSLENFELETKVTFDPEVFFNVLLPPIIFNAGYSLDRRNFFNNIGTIITFAFFGTAISAFVTGSVFYGLTRIWPSLGFKFNDCLFFGATISATDPLTVLAIFQDLKVDSGVYALVFGESMLNDAIAMVLAMAIDKYVVAGGTTINVRSLMQTMWRFIIIFTGSLSIGAAMGCITAILTKFTKIREFPILETALFFLMSYSTFLIAEVIQLSGIVAVLFAGMCQAHYTFYNLSKESQYRTKQIFQLMSFLVENFIFCYIGVSLFTFQNHKFHMGVILAAFIAIFISRLSNIYPLSFILNLGRNRPISLNTQHMLMFSGLRGAMAFALAIRNTSTPQRRALYTTTSIIVIATVFFCGSLTSPMLNWLHIKTGDDNDLDYGNHAIGENRGANLGRISSANVKPDSYSHNFLVRYWSYLDYKILKPLLTQTQPSLLLTLPKFWHPLAKIFTTNEQMRRPLKNSESHLIIPDVGGMDATIAADHAQCVQTDYGTHKTSSFVNDITPHPQQPAVDQLIDDDPPINLRGGGAGAWSPLTTLKLTPDREMNFDKHLNF